MKINPRRAIGSSEPLDLGLSVSIITLNEEVNLKSCLESVAGLANEIIIVDSGSSDRTSEVAAKHGAHFMHNDWPGHVKQKNFALSQCTQPWVLCLDADEALDEELCREIIKLLQGNPKCSGYAVNRLSWFLGDWIRHAWHPEWKLRLVRRESAHWGGMDPHDHLLVEGDTEKLPGCLLHYSFVNLDHHVQKTVGYGRISGAELVKRGKRISIFKLIFSPFWRSFTVFIIKGGWRDGWRGLIVAYTSMLAGFAKYAYAMEAQRVERDDLNNAEDE